MTPTPAREPDDFRQCVRGEITSEEYVRRLRERVRTRRPMIQAYAIENDQRPADIEEHMRTLERLRQARCRHRNAWLDSSLSGIWNICDDCGKKWR